jgi:EAL domain-containing protein (putative c-di-GMP-specific phosphodiesterase class I)
MDRGFVEDIDRDRSARSIVGAVVTMAQALGMSVVAEGVERAEQAAALVGLGCDAAQGHLFGAPAAADVLEERLAPGADVSEERSAAPAARAR